MRPNYTNILFYCLYFMFHSVFHFYFVHSLGLQLTYIYTYQFFEYAIKLDEINEGL
jgi:hypothetical protein